MPFRVESFGTVASPNLPARKGILALRHAHPSQLTQSVGGSRLSRIVRDGGWFGCSLGGSSSLGGGGGRGLGRGGRLGGRRGRRLLGSRPPRRCGVRRVPR